MLRDGNILGWKHGPPISFDSIDWTGSNWDNPNHIDDEDVKRHIESYLVESHKIKPDLETANEQKDLKYIFCFRSPYSWILSKGPRWSGYERDMVGAIQFWSQRAKEYYDFYDKNEDTSIVLTHWDLINDPSQQMKKIQDKFILTPTSHEFISQSLEIGPRLDIDGTRFNNFKYPTKNHFLSRLHPEAIREISARVDKRIMERLGFEIF